MYTTVSCYKYIWSTSWKRLQKSQKFNNRNIHTIKTLEISFLFIFHVGVSRGKATSILFFQIRNLIYHRNKKQKRKVPVRRNIIWKIDLSYVHKVQYICYSRITWKNLKAISRFIFNGFLARSGIVLRL